MLQKNDLAKFSADLENNPEELVKYLDLALEGANLGIWDWYLGDNSVKFDRRWAEMLGLNYDDVKMELATWESRVHPDDLAKAYADIKAYMSGKTNYYENIHRMKHSNGHWVYILDRGRFSDWDKNGNPTRFTGTHFDVTNSERYKRKMSLFFENSPFGYAFCDMNGKLLEINARYSEILGYSLEKIKQLSYWDITPKKYEADEAKQLESLKKTGRYGPYRKEYIRNDGTAVPVELNGFLIEDYDGVKGIWSTVEDISEKKTLESQLIHSSKLASIGVLAAGVGHEINNPLAIISSLVDKMSLEYPDEKNIENIASRMKNAIARISKIVVGLRTFSRLDSKETNVFCVGSAIKESVSMVEEIFRKEGIEFITNLSCDANQMVVNGNRGHLQQVFMNLLSNAKDASAGQSNRSIRINLREVNNLIIIEFTDNGCGIQPENLQRIFDPFFTTKKVNEGTGIGLSIAYSIIQDHQGEITVESSEGKGSTFRIQLPRAQALNNESMKPIKDTSPDSHEHKGDVKFSGTILLVEDEPEILEILAEQLERLGFNVVHHPNGEKALDEYMRDPKKFDLIISDIKMPKVDGLTLIDIVRKQTQQHQPKFILTTGGVNANLDQIFESIKHQLDGVLYKPFDLKKIVNLLQVVLKDSSGNKKTA